MSDTDQSPAEIHRRARESLAAQDFVAVERLCRHALDQNPRDAEALYLLGTAALIGGRPDAAQQCLREATVLVPNRADFLATLAQSYSVTWHHPEAADCARAAAALEPRDGSILNTLGEVLLRADDPQAARPLLEQAVAQLPAALAPRLNLASVCRQLGDLSGARQSCEAALNIDSHCYRAWSMLAELAPASISGQRLAALREAFSMAGSNSPDACLHTGFALARVLETDKQFAEAFAVLAASKAPARRMLNYHFDSDAVIFSTLREVFTDKAVSQHGGEPDAPIFVMGMPRSGTTLVERLLSGHREVISAGEVHNFGILLQRAVGDPGLGVPSPRHLIEAADMNLEALGQRYLESVADKVKGAARFVDKLPHNFLFAGFIARALPGAKMICLRRQPLDTCIGNFRQLFALSFPYYRYSYDIEDTARYYSAFDRLMAHWQQVLPGRILEISYEALVRDPEEQLRGLLDFCELEWDPACLAIEANRTPVSSASAVQVREGIHTRGIDRWRNYAPQLAGAIAILERAGIELSER